MLKLSVGYQYGGTELFSNIIRAYADGIEEVYFSWGAEPNGRPAPYTQNDFCTHQSAILDELRLIKSLGIKLDLLFNANCYGSDAISVALSERVYFVVEFLQTEGVCPDIITTTSPAIAHMIKKRYDGMEVKASVNMKIGTIKGMEYVSHLFDSFCIAKECNRDIERITTLKEWAKANEKKLTMLANSGCMRDCSGQIFHDNMVAHEAGIAQKSCMEFLPYMCWNYLKERNHFPAVLQNTWIRPEDIGHYEGLVDTVKLATRTHRLPGMVIDAYYRRRYAGNLLDLFEPGFGPAFAPYVVDTSKIPVDFWKKTTQCDKLCHRCDYCKTVMENALVMT